MFMYECLSPTDKQYSLRHLPRFRIKTNTYLLQTKCRSSGANKIYMRTFFFSRALTSTMTLSGSGTKLYYIFKFKWSRVILLCIDSLLYVHDHSLKCNC